MENLISLCGGVFATFFCINSIFSECIGSCAYVVAADAAEVFKS